MTKKRYSIYLKGLEKEWSFTVYVDPKFVPEWQEDGILIYEVVNTIPEWMPGFLVRPWCFCQDVFHFKNPFAD